MDDKADTTPFAAPARGAVWQPHQPIVANDSRAARPVYDRPTGTTRLVCAVAAFIVSASLLGTELGLFERQSSHAAMALAQPAGDMASTIVAKGGDVVESRVER